MLKKENTKILKNDLPCGDIKGLSITFLKTFSQQEKAELIKKTQPLMQDYIAEKLEDIKTHPEELSLLKDAMIQFKGESIARVTQGQTLFEPNITLLSRDFLNDTQVKWLTDFLKEWVDAKITHQFGQLFALKNHDEKGIMSGLLFQIFENHGWVQRSEVSSIMNDLSLEEKGRLKKRGVYLGAFSIYLKSVLERSTQELMTILWNAFEIKHRFTLMDGGHTSFSLKNDKHADYASFIGYMPLGKTAVRLDMLERLNSKLYDTAEKGIVELKNEMVNMIGIDFARAHKLLGQMGFKAKSKEKRLYHLPSNAAKKKREETKSKQEINENSPFAALQKLKENS